MTAVLALTASLLWGLADFGGGLQTRRLPALLVVVASQAATVPLLLVLVPLTGGFELSAHSALFAAGAGVFGAVAIYCFYEALSLGPMGVVSPLTTIGLAVPVALGFVLGERPGALQIAGIAVAVTGVVLAGGPQLRGASVQRRTLAHASVAALGFGIALALLAQAGQDPHAVLPTLLVQRLASVGAGVVTLIALRRRTPAEYRGPGLGPANLPGLALIGAADVAANGVYVLACRSGSLAVGTVLASLYPVVTALAARVWLRERLLPVQATGAGLALAGTLLLAAR